MILKSKKIEQEEVKILKCTKIKNQLPERVVKEYKRTGREPKD